MLYVTKGSNTLSMKFWSPPAINGFMLAMPVQQGPTHAPVIVPPDGALGSKTYPAGALTGALETSGVGVADRAAVAAEPDAVALTERVVAAGLGDVCPHAPATKP